jgi:subtilase family serine protease
VIARSGRIWALVALAAVAAAGGAGLALAPHAGRPAPSASIAGHARRVGPLANGTIRFALNLRLRDRALDGYLRHVSPAGARGALTASTFGTRFGQSDWQLARLRGVLDRLGITVDHLYPQRTAMLVRSSVPVADRVFSLRFDRYRMPDGRGYFAPTRPPRIPASLAPFVTGLGDLSDQPIPSADVPSSGLTPSVTAKAYDIAPLYAAGIRGQGQTIAIATPGGAINPADLQAYESRTGVSAQQIAVKQVDGGSRYDPRQGSDIEVDLDMQVILGLLPDAHIIDYQGPDGSNGGPQVSWGHSLADIYNQIEQDGQTHIVSTSYGKCETAVAHETPGDQQLMDNSLKALEASNVTVFVASGDTGAYACLRAFQIQPATRLPAAAVNLAVLTPGSSPFVVSVGGTRLEVRSDGGYLTESAWTNPLERAGGGGGVSDSEPRPSWQQGPGVSQPALNPGGMRQVPDVAGPSDPNTGFLVCKTDAGSSTPRCPGAVGGTSAATPFWAASMVLVQQYAAAHGAGSFAQCFAAPILYDLATKRQPIPPFHQVTLGNNGYYPATPGWNFATGLGSPDVFNLAQDYASFLRSLPSRRCPF